MTHHTIDVHPIPKESMARFINEPWLVDRTLAGLLEPTEPERQEDNVRIYVPIDLNREAILRRLREIINRYEEANEDNEMDFESEVWQLVSQIEIYDQIWSIRNTSKHGRTQQKSSESDC